jgi:hypothetical protein
MRMGDSEVLACVVASVGIPESIGAPSEVLILLAFLVAGIDMVIHPKRHMKNAWLRRGGEMLREWNETGVQGLGLVVTGVSAWILYDLLHRFWYKGL